MLSPPVLWFHVQTSGEGTDEVGGDRRPSEAPRTWQGVGIFKSLLSDLCPQATPKQETLPEEGD